MKRKMTVAETLRVTRFLSQIESAASGISSEIDPQRKLVLFLIENYLQDEPVTTSSLAAESTLPHATALRRIRAMIERGEIIKKSKGQGRKTFFLAPSDELLERFDTYASIVKQSIAETVGVGGGNAEDSYFGAGDFSRDLIPPSNLVEQINKSGIGLRFLVNDDNFFSAMKNMWSDYRFQLGSPHDFAMVPLNDLYERVKVELERSSGNYDIVAIDTPWVGDLSSEGLLRPLNDFIEATHFDKNRFDGKIWATGSWSSSQVGLPIYTTIEVLAARADLFQSTAIIYPRTFDETIYAAAKLNKPASDIFGIGWNAAAGHPIASSFMIFLGSCGAPLLKYPLRRTHYDWSAINGDALRPNLLSDQAYEVLDFMHRMIPYSPPGILRTDWNDQLRLLMNGHLSMAFCWSMRAALVTNFPNSKVKNKINFLPQPKGKGGFSANPIGGFHLAIPQNISDERARLAFDAITWLSKADGQSPSGIPIMPHFSQAVDPELIRGAKIFKFIENLARRGMLCNSQRPPLPEYRQIEAILGQKIHAALSGELTDREALTQAHNGIDALMRVNGRY